MSSHEITTSGEAITVEGFEAYALETKHRINNADWVLRQGMELLADLGQTNAALTAADRPDLAIRDRAGMMPISHPHEIIEESNNFIPNFCVLTRPIDTGKKNWDGEPIFRAKFATAEEIDEIRSLPNLDTYEELSAIRDRGQYAALRGGINHTSKKAYIRMLTLFPDFTKDLAVGISAANRSYGRFEAETFVAYQLMSRLVDKSDQYVAKESGEIDDWYLCR